MNKALLFFWGLGLIFFLPVWAQAPVPSGDPVKRFVFHEQVLDAAFQLEVYSAQAGAAQKLATDIWQELKLQVPLLAEPALEKLEKAAQLEPVVVSEPLFNFLKALLNYHRLSQGALDPTSQPLYALWGFVPGSFNYHLPGTADWEKIKPLLDASALKLMESPFRLQISKKNLRLNLRPGLQGFLIDRAVPLLKKSGLVAALSTREVGYYQGVPPGAQAWKVAMPHPQMPGRVFSYLYVKDQALARISVLSNTFTYGGLNYHDLLDARTGQPTEQGLALSITRPNALAAELSAHLLIRLTSAEIQKVLPELEQTHALKLVSQNSLLIPLEYSH